MNKLILLILTNKKNLLRQFYADFYSTGKYEGDPERARFKDKLPFAETV